MTMLVASLALIGLAHLMLVASVLGTMAMAEAKVKGGA